MGRSYGVTLLRGVEASRVEAACAELAEELKARFFVVETAAGWTAIYPDRSGQDPQPAVRLSARLEAAAVHLLLHDSDFAAYLLAEGGEIVERWGHPHDYFDDAADREPLPAGRVGRLFVDKAAREAFAAWLDPAGDPPAETRLEELARLLGAAGLLGGFEEIDEGLPPSGLGSARPVRVEAASAAERRKAERAEARAANRRLREDGLLLDELSRRGEGRGLHPHPVVAAMGPGFVVAWSSVFRPIDEPVEEPPAWLGPTGEGPATLPPISGRVHTLAVGGPANDLLAVGHASGDWSLALYDLATGSRRVSLPQSRAVDWLGFSPDGSVLMALSSDELTLLPLYGSRPLDEAALRLRLPHPATSAAVHPSGDRLVVSTEWGLILVDLTGPAVTATIELWRRDHNAWLSAVRRGEAESAFSHAERPRPLASDPGGRRLAIGTDQGIRVVEWEALAAGRIDRVASAPVPLVRVGGDSLMRSTYACLFTPDGRSVLYAGLEGRLQRLEVESGTSTLLVELPGRAPVIRLQTTAGCDRLATVARPGLFDRHPPPALLQIWDLARLLRRDDAGGE